ncbi:MAG: hypothetical protein U9R51_03870 [Actinomycetota bacterium]|nr:hypothetical protein [Actinomycetota bacterium]
MTRQILIGMLVTSSLLVACAAEPEERAPAPAAENATTSVGEPTEQLGSEVDASSGEDQAVFEAEAPAPSMATTPPDQVSSQSTPTTTTPAQSPDETPTADPGEVTVEEPTPTEAETPELPEPGGPWVEPGEPDFTKTVPPPRD